MGTFIVLAIVILGAGLAGRAMWKDHKAGKHCAGCPATAEAAVTATTITPPKHLPPFPLWEGRLLFLLKG